MKFQYVFEKSKAWNQSVDLTKEVHDLDSRFHNYEKFEIIKKLREGSVSISADIAVASTHSSAKKQNKIKSRINKNITRFLSHLFIAKEMAFINQIKFDQLKSKVDTISNFTSKIHESKHPVQVW